MAYLVIPCIFLIPSMSDLAVGKGGVAGLLERAGNGRGVI